MKVINFDKAATTKTDPTVLEKVMPYLTDNYENASSAYLAASSNKEAIEHTRSIIADYLSCNSKHIFFTSSASEGNSWVIRDFVEHTGDVVAYSSIEHIDIILAAKDLAKTSIELPVDKFGRLQMDVLENICCDYNKMNKHILFCIQYVNNELGIIQDIPKISEIAHKYGHYVLCDATQAITHIYSSVGYLGCDFLTASGHKFNALKGVGFLYSRYLMKPLIYGHQQNGLRGGTYNTPNIVSIGLALQLKRDNEKLELLRDYFEKEIKDNIDETYINCGIFNRSNHISSICFTGIDAESLLLLLSNDGFNGDHIYVSAGSACNSAKEEPSHVLKAIGMKEPDILSVLRFSFDDDNTKEEVDFVVNKLKYYVELLRGLSE